MFFSYVNFYLKRLSVASTASDPYKISSAHSKHNTQVLGIFKKANRGKQKSKDFED